MSWQIPEFFTLPQVASRLGKSQRWLREFLNNNPVGKRLGRTILLTELDVEAILNKMEGKNFKPNVVVVERRWRQPPLTINPSRSGNVYFIRSGGYVKIGVAMNVAQRFATLQVAHPEDLDLLLEVPGGPQEEAVLHKRFHADRVRGEWFRYSGAIQSWIVEQRSAACEHA